MRNNGEDLRAVFDQAANHLRKIICFHHAKPEKFTFKVKMLRERLETFHSRRADSRDLDFDLGLGRLPPIHLVFANNAPVLNEGHAIAALFHFTEQVRIEKDCRAAIALLPDHIAYQFASGRIEARGVGSSRKSISGSLTDRLCETGALHHSLGKTSDGLVVLCSQPDSFEQPRNFAPERAFRQAAKSAVKQDKLRSREPIIEAEVLGEESNAGPHRSCAHRLTQQESVAAGRLYQA